MVTATLSHVSVALIAAVGVSRWHAIPPAPAAPELPPVREEASAAVPIAGLLPAPLPTSTGAKRRHRCCQCHRLPFSRCRGVAALRAAPPVDVPSAIADGNQTLLANHSAEHAPPDTEHSLSGAHSPSASSAPGSLAFAIFAIVLDWLVVMPAVRSVGRCCLRCRRCANDDEEDDEVGECEAGEEGEEGADVAEDEEPDDEEHRDLHGATEAEQVPGRCEGGGEDVDVEPAAASPPGRRGEGGPSVGHAAAAAEASLSLATESPRAAASEATGEVPLADGAGGGEGAESEAPSTPAAARSISWCLDIASFSNDADAVAQAQSLVTQAWVVDDPRSFAVFEERREEEAYHRRRSQALCVLTKAFLAVQEVGSSMIAEQERLQQENSDIAGEVAYWRAMAEEAYGSLAVSPAGCGTSVGDGSAQGSGVGLADMVPEDADGALLHYLPGYAAEADADTAKGAREPPKRSGSGSTDVTAETETPGDAVAATEDEEAAGATDSDIASAQGQSWPL